MKKIIDVIKKKYTNEDQELIRNILGRNKFLMLNLNLVKALRPDGACYLTFLLDKAEYLLSTGDISSLDEGFYVFRRDFQQNIGLNIYYQKKIEASLEVLGLIRIVENRERGETWNQYYLIIDKIFELVEPVDVGTPVKV
jgi:hypothetical protein